jgi:hypothetical protein
MKLAYVIMGFCGMYDDRMTWPAAVALTEAEGLAHAEKLNAWCVENGVDQPHEFIGARTCPLDPKFKTDDSTGTSYRAFSVPMVES